MDEYIKKSDIGLTDFEIILCKGDYKEALLMLFDKIEHLPAADVRPVVFCRDCKHSTLWYSNKSRCFLWHEDGIDVFNDGFCNYGEKREES